MPTLAEDYAAAGKRDRKKMSQALSSLTHRGVMRCIMSLRTREWHEESIAFRLEEIISVIGNRVAQSPAIAAEGAMVTPKNLTNAIVIGTQVAIELDIERKGGEDVG